jgi:hypothetical protein
MNSAILKVALVIGRSISLMIYVIGKGDLAQNKLMPLKRFITVYVEDTPHE